MRDELARAEGELAKEARYRANAVKVMDAMERCSDTQSKLIDI